MIEHEDRKRTRTALFYSEQCKEIVSQIKVAYPNMKFGMMKKDQMNKALHNKNQLNI